MHPLVMLLLVAFALGYGVRELISRRRRKKYKKRVVAPFEPNEIDQLVLDLRDGATSRAEAQPSEKPTNSPISQPESASLEQRIERLRVVMRPNARSSPADKVKQDDAMAETIHISG